MTHACGTAVTAPQTEQQASKQASKRTSPDTRGRGPTQPYSHGPVGDGDDNSVAHFSQFPTLSVSQCASSLQNHWEVHWVLPAPFASSIINNHDQHTARHHHQLCAAQKGSTYRPLGLGLTERPAGTAPPSAALPSAAQHRAVHSFEPCLPGPSRHGRAPLPQKPHTWPARQNARSLCQTTAFKHAGHVSGRLDGVIPAVQSPARPGFRSYRPPAWLRQIFGTAAPGRLNALHHPSNEAHQRRARSPPLLPTTHQRRQRQRRHIRHVAPRHRTIPTQHLTTPAPPRPAAPPGPGPAPAAPAALPAATAPAASRNQT